MKTKTIIVKMFILIALLTWSCNKNDDTQSPTSQVEEIEEENDNTEIEELAGITENDLEQYKGQIGIGISARNIAKKGYLPAKAVITVNANLGNYNQTIDIDEYTNIAQLSVDLESLSEEAREELEDGVPVNADILDKDNAILKSESFSVISFKSSPIINEVDAKDMEYQFQEISFREGVPYYLQIANEDGNFGSEVVTFRGGLMVGQPTNFSENDHNTSLYLYKIPNSDDEFTIIFPNDISNSSFTQTHMNIIGHFSSVNNEIFDASNLSSFPPERLFKIKREKNGLYTIINSAVALPMVYKEGLGFEGTYYDPSTKLNFNDFDGYPIAYFRIFTMKIDWQVEQLESIHMQPVLPPVDTGFGFNSTLTNCGTGDLEQQVGIERTIETSTTVGWEESISLSSSETFGGSVTVGVKTEASFFGNGVEVSAEATASYEYSSEATSTNSQFEENTQLETQTYFSNRTITVPSGKASLVYDAYQLYSDVKMPFVQRFRIKGKYQDDNTPLTGEEITTQFFSNSFNGVITKVESDYIEVTVRGTTTLNNYVETESTVKDVPVNCN